MKVALSHVNTLVPTKLQSVKLEIMLARTFRSESPKTASEGLVPPVDTSCGESTTTEFASAATKDEADARACAQHNQFYLVVVNSIAAIFVFLFYLVSVEGLIGIGLSIGFTIYAYNKTDDAYNANTFDGSIMNWILLSFAVITPMSAAVTMAFARREQGLFLIATIKGTLLELYMSHALWDWDKDRGRADSDVDWLAHADETCTQILGSCSDITRFLTLPDTTRARHKTTQQGRKEAKEVADIRIRLHESIIYRFGRLAQLCEVLKREGLPPNEATRVRQWERLVLESVEKLLKIKMYRTPQGLRSFCRLFSVFLPPFYAPYYAQMAYDLNSLAVAIVFSVLTSIALTALFETVYQMEDPFLPGNMLDGVNVKQELIDYFRPQMMVLRKQFFPTAPAYTCTVDKK